MQLNDDKQTGLSWSAPTPKQNASARPASATPTSKTVTTSKGPLYASLLVAGVAVGVLAAWSSGFWSKTQPAETTSNTTSAQTINDTNTAILAEGLPAKGSDPSFTILTPQKAGLAVSIYKAIVAEPTWVVVYEDNGGKPGNALGAALFFPEHQAGAVELLRATIPGRSYLAVKQVDNGDRRFSLHEDVMLAEGGEVQWVEFSVQ